MYYERYKMIKIGVVVDPHLVERACRCRKDNFFETALGKLDYIASENDYVLIFTIILLCSSIPYLL